MTTVPDSADQSAIQEVLQYLRNTAGGGKKKRGEGEGVREEGGGEGAENAAVKKNKRRGEPPQLRSPLCVRERRKAACRLAASRHPCDESA